MPRFSITAKMPVRINKKAYFKAHEDYIFEVMRLAGQAFVEAAYQNVPVRSGMARGSLYGRVTTWKGDYESSDELFGFSPPIVPIEYNKKYYVQSNQRFMNRISGIQQHIRKTENKMSRGWIPKIPETGALLGDYKIRKERSKNYRIQFIFESGVMHYTYNEFNNNWRSLEVGSSALSATMEKLLTSKKMPKAFKYLEYIRISGGKNMGILKYKED